MRRRHTWKENLISAIIGLVIGCLLGAMHLNSAANTRQQAAASLPSEPGPMLTCSFIEPIPAEIAPIPEPEVIDINIDDGRQPEIIELRVKEPEDPIEIEYPDVPVIVTDHDLDQTEVNTMAEFLWKSPLRHEQAKRDLLWVVFNRVDDTSDLFPDDIESVCRNKKEWAHMSAHRFALSDENLRIVREEMNRWKSLKEGHYVGSHPPRTAIYVSFCGEKNQKLKFFDKTWCDIDY